METVNYSIIKKSQLEGAARLDAEYYQPVFLDVSKKLQKIKTIKLGEFCKITDGDHAKIPGFVVMEKRNCQLLVAIFPRMPILKPRI